MTVFLIRRIGHAQYWTLIGGIEQATWRGDPDKAMHWRDSTQCREFAATFFVVNTVEVVQYRNGIIEDAPQ